MATKKNRIENGRRADPSGSNPHSYGDSFSWSGVIWGSQKDTVVKIMESVRVIKIIVITKFIIFPWTLTKAR